MDRRRFLQNLAVTAAAAEAIESIDAFAAPQAPASTEGYMLVAEFEGWKVHEDLRTRDGSLAFTGPRGAHRVLAKSAEPCFPTAEPSYLGLKMEDIGMSGPRSACR